MLNWLRTKGKSPQPQTQTHEAFLSALYEKASESETMDLVSQYKTTRLGMTEEKHAQTLDQLGYNIVTKKKKHEALRHFITTSATPFNGLLLTLSIVMYITDNNTGGSIILAMILLSVVTGFIQERRSNQAVEQLQKMVSNKASVYRLVRKDSLEQNRTSEVKIVAEVKLAQFNHGHVHLNLLDNQLTKSKDYSELLKDLNWYSSHPCREEKIEDEQIYTWIETDVPSHELVEGDIILLSAGDLTPADCRLLTSKDLFVSQATMTGESMPVEKMAGKERKDRTDKQNATIFDVSNIILMGTSVISGTATALVLKTGRNTYFGSIVKTVEGSRQQTAFDRGINKFILMMVCFMVTMSISTLLINGFMKKDWGSAIQFALAVAVGLTPEMLPMIITVTLAKGAIKMSKSKVIVKRLKAIQNFGAMNILCTDKTGTLTQDEVVLEHYVDVMGQESMKVLEYAFYNSNYQTGLRNLLDKAILKRAEKFNFGETKGKVDEIPFDFERRRMSVIIGDQDSEGNMKNHLLICKGAIEEVLGISKSVLVKEDQIDIFNDQNQSDLVRRKSVEVIIDKANSLEIFKIQVKTSEEDDEKAENVDIDSQPELEIPEFDKKNEVQNDLSRNFQIKPLTSEAQKKILDVAHQLNQAGLRVICVAVKKFDQEKKEYGVKDECDLIVAGFIAFLDPPKPTTIQSLEALKDAGIAVKVLTGDNELVAKAVCQQVGINTENIVLGASMNNLKDEELLSLATKSSVFCKLTPSQKKRVVTVLQSAGNVVGFLGDGINDSPALRAADVGITVDNAVDIAKESADIILLEKSLLVLGQGVKEGRTVFGNIIKYIKMGSSSNFGNVFSVTGASILLPFIPMQPVQLLCQNLLYDFSQCGIPFDNVDKEYTSKPRKWEIADIAKFMLFIGPISSLFDFTTFGLMWFFFEANSVEKQTLFQTGWFIEGLISQTLIVHAIRTSKIPFIQSIASKQLILCTSLTIIAAITLIHLPFAKYIPFQALPALYYPFLLAMIISYFTLCQIAKSIYYRKFGIM